MREFPSDGDLRVNNRESALLVVLFQSQNLHSLVLGDQDFLSQANTNKLNRNR